MATSALAQLGVSMLLVGCASQPSASPHRELDALWRDYQELPAHRALAIAGEIRSERWVAGVSAGRASVDEARSQALEQCGRQRQKARMQSACSLYAVGDEIVWTRR
jgi:hypothetical protein